MFAQVSKKALLAAVCAATVGVGAQAAVVWDGGGTANLLFDDANYDFSGSTVTSVDPVTPVLDDLTYTGATIAATDGGRLDIGNGFTITLDGTSLALQGSNGIAGVAAGASSFLNLTNNSSLTTQFVTVGMIVSVDGTSSITFLGAGDAINSQTEPSSVTLAQGGQITGASTAWFTAQGNEIFAANSSGVLVSYNSDNTILSFNGTTATAVNAVPEPGSLALLGLGGLLIARRRRA